MTRDYKYRRALARYMGDSKVAYVPHEHTSVPKNPILSKYGHPITNSPEITQLTQTLRRGSRSSGRKITLPKISKGASDE